MIKIFFFSLFQSRQFLLKKWMAIDEMRSTLFSFFKFFDFDTDFTNFVEIGSGSRS